MGIHKDRDFVGDSKGLQGIQKINRRGDINLTPAVIILY